MSCVGGPIVEVFAALAERIVTEVAPPVDMQGCSARMLAALDAAVTDRRAGTG